MIKFKTFTPSYSDTAAERLTAWLVEHPYVELVCWQATQAGKDTVLTIQYKEN
jgi:hypothetical protein